MRIRFSLNGEPTVIDVQAERRLSEVLHDDLHMLSVRTVCNSGVCGACTVLIGGKAQLSCLIPCFAIQGDSIVTFEGFSLTKEYKDLQRAFQLHGYTPCSYCLPSKALTIHALLLHNGSPDENQILNALSGIRCSCDALKPLGDSVMTASALRRQKKRAR